MIYIGIDPGKNGGMAYLNSKGEILDTFKFKTTETDISLMFNQYITSTKFALIEKVHAMPVYDHKKKKMIRGATSTFSFGMNYGFLRACLICNKIPFDEVPPNTWQKALHCQTGGDKNVSKAKAQQLFPNIKITHAIADALLIAYYNLKTWKNKTKGD